MNLALHSHLCRRELVAKAKERGLGQEIIQLIKETPDTYWDRPYDSNDWNIYEDPLDQWKRIYLSKVK